MFHERLSPADADAESTSEAGIGAQPIGTAARRARPNRNPAACRRGELEAHFVRMWEAAEPIIEFGSATDALEPK